MLFEHKISQFLNGLELQKVYDDFGNIVSTQTFAFFKLLKLRKVYFRNFVWAQNFAVFELSLAAKSLFR